MKKNLVKLFTAVLAVFVLSFTSFSQNYLDALPGNPFLVVIADTNDFFTCPSTLPYLLLAQSKLAENGLDINNFRGKVVCAFYDKGNKGKEDFEIVAFLEFSTSYAKRFFDFLQEESKDDPNTKIGKIGGCLFISGNTDDGKTCEFILLNEKTVQFRFCSPHDAGKILTNVPQIGKIARNYNRPLSSYFVKNSVAQNSTLSLVFFPANLRSVDISSMPGVDRDFDQNVSAVFSSFTSLLLQMKLLQDDGAMLNCELFFKDGFDVDPLLKDVQETQAIFMENLKKELQAEQTTTGIEYKTVKTQHNSIRSTVKIPATVIALFINRVIEEVQRNNVDTGVENQPEN